MKKNSDHYPDFFARFYDVIYEKIRTEDFNFFLEKLLGANGPVLEVGVGTGRFFLEAHKQGADIYGIDVSPAMIDVLRKKIPSKATHRVEVADICSWNSEKKFSLIIAPFRVFSHILTIENQLAALENMYHLLLPGGELIFDLFVPNLAMLVNGLDHVLDFEGEYEPGKKVKRYTSMFADPVQQISYVTFNLEWEEEDGWKKNEWLTQMRFFHYHELTHLLERSPFSSFNIYGGFEQEKISKDSKEFIVQCSK